MGGRQTLGGVAPTRTRPRFYPRNGALVSLASFFAAEI
jgi:hypothetical protein